MIQLKRNAEKKLIYVQKMSKKEAQTGISYLQNSLAVNMLKQMFEVRILRLLTHFNATNGIVN